jgi:HSP20 family protein
MDQLFDRGFSRPWRLIATENGANGFFPVDLLETDEDVVVKASLPGVKPDDVHISVTEDTLTIKGEASSETEEKKANYYRQERHFGAFQRTFTLPVRVEAEKAEATFEHGVLNLRLPKAQDVRPKTIEVKPKAVVEGATS